LSDNDDVYAMLQTNPFLDFWKVSATGGTLAHAA
jgi:hypothetical protein